MIVLALLEPSLLYNSSPRKPQVSKPTPKSLEFGTIELTLGS